MSSSAVLAGMPVTLGHSRDATKANCGVRFAVSNGAHLDMFLTQPCYVAAMPKTPRPIEIGGVLYPFKWDGRKIRPTSATPLAGGDGADVEVRVELFEDRDRVICGQVTVSTVALTEEQREETLGEAGTPTHIDSALWRQLPIGTMVEDAIQSTRELAAELYRVSGRRYYERASSLKDDKKRPGPRPILTPELLAEVVVPAFKSGGRKSVVAVQKALEEAGYPGAGPDGDVTIDQARKAVQKARRLELLPRPARAPRRGGHA